MELSDIDILPVAFIAWIAIGAIVGYLIGQSKGRAQEGAAMGAILGVIGWFLLLVGPDKRRKCPQCLGAVPDQAQLCQHCGSELQG